MSEKFSEEKSKLKEYLQAKGITINKNILRCPNPSHSDENPSAVFYDNSSGKYKNPSIHCPVCSKTWGIFDICGMIEGVSNFSDKLKLVRQSLNIPHKTKKKKEQKPISLTLDEAKKIYSRKAIENNAKKIEEKQKRILGEIIGSWKYTNDKGDIIALDVKFKNNENKKNIITFWYNGKNIKSANPPKLIYNLYEALQSTDKPLLINEGAKCAELARQLKDFIPVSWNGGSGKAHLINWSVFKNREIFMYRDDDEAGLKAALKIKEKLSQLKIIKPLVEARKIKEKGADIEEALQCITPEELTQYIFLSPAENIESDIRGPENPQRTACAIGGGMPPDHQITHVSGPDMSDSMPFRCLGIGDDGRAVFITEAGRVEKYKLDSLSKQKLMVLANRQYWYNDYENRDGKISWDSAIDDVIRLSQNKDYNNKNIRGRGAWRDGDKISYHDGLNTYGEYLEDKIYLRLPRRDIGINDEPANKKLTSRIKDIIFKMSFETPADAVRCMAWSILAPFAGGLKYRPAMLLTGPSGSGKTTVANLCIRKLACCEWFNGSESTVAGIRGVIKYDSCGIMLDEVESDTMKKSINRNELLSLMRVSVSDDAPDTVKGTKDGGYNSYKMQNMFGFIAIDPTLESVADENRIFRINMIKPKNRDNWKGVEKELLSLMTEKNNRSIRALTWNKLKNILELSNKLVDIIREKTNRDFRSSYADAMLVAAYMVVWAGTENPSEKQIENMLNKYYEFQPVEEHRDEAEEIIDRLMSETIEVIYDGIREKISIIEIINRCYYETAEYGSAERELSEQEKTNYELHLSRYGIRVLEKGDVSIANNHHAIMKIIKTGEGYNKIFQRYINYSHSEMIYYKALGKSRRSTILKNIIRKKYEHMTKDEELELLFS